MKTKNLLILILSFCLCLSLVVVSGCSEKHTHSYSSEWTFDAEYHWHACSGCSELSDKAAHDWNDGEVTTEPKATTMGVKTFTCKVCSQTKTENIDALGAQNASVVFTSTYNPSKTYDGVAVTAPATADYTKTGNGAVSIEWYKGTTKLDGAPVNAGEYKVKIVVAATPEYKSANAEKSFTIAKADATLSFAETYSLNKDYNGIAVANPTAENYITNSDGTVTVEWYQGATKLTSAPKDAGDYKVKVIIAESNNYKTISAEKSFTIAKADATLSFAETYSLNKDYNSIAVANPTAENYITNSDGTVTVEWYQGATKLTSAPKDAGDYKVKVIIAESNNYKTISAEKSFTISKKAITVNFSESDNNYSFEYDGTEKSTEVYTVSGFVAGDANPSASATGDRVNVTTDGFDVIVALNVTAGKENNYTLPESASLTQNYKITPKTISVTNIEVGDKSYNGKTDAVINDYQTDGLLADDETYVDVGFTSASFAQAEIGQNISVNIAITLTGPRAKNYALSSSTVTATANIVESVQFVIKDQFNISGNVVVTGDLVAGIIYVGDTLVFDGVSGIKTVTVNGIEKGNNIFSSIISSEDEGDIGLLLGGITKTEIANGDYLVSENSNMFKVVSFTASVYFKTKEEGGRHTPAVVNYSPSISCGLYIGKAKMVAFTGSENSESILPGETVTATFELTVPGYVEIGDEFTLIDIDKTVADGTITGIEQVSISGALLGAVSLGGNNKTYNFVNIPEGVKEIAINGISFAAATNCYFLYDTTKATCTVTKVSDSTTVALTPATGGERASISMPTNCNVVFTNITSQQFELTIRQMAR